MNKIEKLASKYIYWPELENPFQKNISFGENTLSDFHPIVHKNVNSKKVDVENEIVEFYALNQYLSQQRIKDGDVMSSELIDTYKEYKNKIDNLSEKMFSYIFVISMMEARHCYDFTEETVDIDETVDEWANDYEEENGKPPSNLKIKEYTIAVTEEQAEKNCISYKKNCPPGFYPTFKKCYTFLTDLYAKNSSSYRGGMINKVLPSFKDSNIKVEEFLKTISMIFERDNFESGFGGEPWKNIAEHGLKFAKGELNAEVFVDQAFSLEHNGGCMFNKSTIFNSIDNVSINTGDDYISISKTQFLLNMQHSGELLNFLSINNYTKEDINSLTEKLNLRDATLEGADVNINKSLKRFFSDIKRESANFAKSPIIREILQREKNNLSTIDFRAFLSEQKDEYGDIEEILSYTQIHVLDLAKKVTSNLNKPVRQRNNYTKKNVLFEVFDTSKIPATHQSKDVLGGKAFGLSQMNKMDLPVPKAAVWTCENFRSFDQFPDSWAKTLHKQMSGINGFNTDKDGNPVMVSIRSGAPVSMPGMMDTILNVGIDSTNYEYFSKKIGQATTDECAIRFMKLFTKSFFNKEYEWPKTLPLANKKFRKILDKFDIKTGDGEFPLTKERQIALSLEAVFQSWNSDRAVAYREHHKIDHDMGTAAIMQHMVLGNLNDKSCTGVLFSRDCIKGNKGIIGEFLVCGQGEEVVSGEVTPQNISEMKKWNPEVYKQLSEIAARLEEKTGEIQDIEFTVEDGNLYILQCRTAVSSPNAKIQLLHEKLNENKITFNEFLAHIDHTALMPDNIVNTKDPADFKGMCASPGVIKGICIRSEKDIEKYGKKAKDENLKFILISEETKPEHAPIMIKSDAFLTQKGGFTSHAAILARSWNKPCIVGSEKSKSLKIGDVVTMDAKNGHVWLGAKDIGKKKDSSIIKEIIASNLIKLDQSPKQEKEIAKINNEKYWMNFGNKTKEVKPVVKKFTKFLDMGYLSVMKMSVAAKNNSSMSMTK